MNPTGHVPGNPGPTHQRMPPPPPPPATAIQPCARCGTQWPVHGVPVQWCPRCRGPLLGAAVVGASPWRRNYRWVVRQPRRRSPRPAAPARPTPSYAGVPRWGLTDVVPQQRPPAESPLARLAGVAPRLLVGAAVAFGFAALAEFFRYALLLWNRSRLVDGWLVRFSDGWVVAASVLAPLLGLLTALAMAAWLAAWRRQVFAAHGRSDPYPFWILVLGCCVPFVNLIAPGVFLAGATDAGQRRQVRIWWGAWLFGALMVAVSFVFRFAHWLPGTLGHASGSLQFKANGVLFAAETNLVAAGVAVATLWLLRVLEGRDIRGQVQAPRRLLVVAGPARPVIAEVAAPASGDGGKDSDSGRPAATSQAAAA